MQTQVFFCPGRKVYGVGIHRATQWIRVDGKTQFTCWSLGFLIVWLFDVTHLTKFNEKIWLRHLLISVYWYRKLDEWSGQLPVFHEQTNWMKRIIGSRKIVYIYFFYYNTLTFWLAKRWPAFSFVNKSFIIFLITSSRILSLYSSGSLIILPRAYHLIYLNLHLSVLPRSIAWETIIPVTNNKKCNVGSWILVDKLEFAFKINIWYMIQYNLKHSSLVSIILIFIH